MIKPLTYMVPRWTHQAEGEERAVANYLAEKSKPSPRPGFAFLFDPGTGKTMTTINTIRRLIVEEQRELRTLIFCPPVVVSNWKAEFIKFSKIDPRTIHLLTGTGEKRVNRFREAAFLPTGERQACTFVTNYESVVGKPGSNLDELYNLMIKWRPEILVLDEMHYLKDYKSERTKKIDMLANPIDRKSNLNLPRPMVLGLTGTPLLNTSMDIFPQWMILDGGDSFGENFFEFRARFFKDLNANMPTQRYFPKWVIKPSAKPVIEGVMSRRSMSALKEHCLDLPPLVKRIYSFEMGKDQARHYDEMKRQLVTYIESDACVAELAITKALRLMQIASGFVRDESGDDHTIKDAPKIGYLQEMLSNYAGAHKIIVWAVFKQNYLQIKEACARLKLPMVTLHGGMTNRGRDESIKAFNTDPKVRILVGHPQSGGIGANLTASDLAINYSFTFNAGHRLQAQARNHRGGSEIHSSITWTDLAMEGTIEEDILKSLDQKTQIGLSVLRALVCSRKSLGGMTK